MGTPSTRQGWQRQREFHRDAENQNPVTKAAAGNFTSLVFRPGCKRLGLSEGCEESIVASVPSLYLAVYKLAILRAVVAIVVGSLKREPRSVAVVFGPSLEGSEVLPCFTHADAPGSIESEAPVFGPRASVPHLLPYAIQRIVADPGRCGHCQQQLYIVSSSNNQRVSPRVTGVNGTSASPRGEGA
jgi:hypothetical protein